MKLSKQRKVFIAILALALTALGADRVFPGGGQASPPAAAAAPSTPAPSGPDPAGEPRQAAAVVAMAKGESLAARLKKSSKSQGIDMKSVRDAFAPSEAWLPKPEPVRVTTRPAVQKPKFGQTHQLMAVMAGSGGSAIVDGKCVLIGQKLDGYTLVSVGERSAVFQSGSDRVELVLKEQSTK